MQLAVVQTVPVPSCEVAEACKILENTYRSVNIAMVNEMKVLFDRLGIDIWQVIESGQNETVWFSGILSRTGTWRPLYSHRSVLFKLGSP